MTEEIELYKAGFQFLNANFDSLLNKVRRFYKNVSHEVTLSWRLSYERYLETAGTKYFYSKNFLNSIYPTPLYDFYVPLQLSSGERLITEPTINDLTLSTNFAVIMANAGSGKSMMMKHLFLNTIDSTDRVPVFVELRDLNDSDFTLFDLIIKKLRENKFELDDEYIRKAFQAGHFALFLDGFDEVSRDRRKSTVNEIQELADNDPDNFVVVSSRPDDSLFKWVRFEVWVVEPLDVNLACALVEKASGDFDVKDKFIKALQDGLFAQHESFLSNPLLLSIMLITYKDSANIPNKLSTFYDRAYVALFERHDALKGAFHREKRSNLDIQEFRRVFSCFCFVTYSKSKYGFSDTDIYDYLETAKRLSGITFDKAAYLDDAIQAVCLLVRDGLDIVFAHRSFQEYFTAMFVVQMSDVEKRDALVVKYFDAFMSHDLSALIHECSPEVVESAFLIPNLDTLAMTINFNGKITPDVYATFLKTLFNAITLLDEDGDLSLGVIIRDSTLLAAYELAIGYSKTLLGVEYEWPDFHDALAERYYEIADPDESGLHDDIPIYLIIEDPKMYELFSAGNHRFCSDALNAAFTIKNLIEKRHVEQRDLIAQLLQ